MQEQDHPLYKVDRETIDRLLAQESPKDQDVVDLARLFLRYEGFPGALDIQDDMERALRLWDLTRESLNKKAREIWERGFRPGITPDEAVGSSFDTSEN